MKQDYIGHRTIQDYTGVHRQDNTGLYRTINDHTELYKTIHDYTEL